MIVGMLPSFGDEPRLRVQSVRLEQDRVADVMSSKRKYEYTPEEELLLWQAATGGVEFRNRVFASLQEWAVLTASALTIVTQARPAREEVARFYAKVVGNIVAHEQVPISSKKRLLSTFSRSIGADRAREIVQEIDAQLEESDKQRLDHLLAKEDRTK